MIEKVLPGNRTRLKIVRCIYENPGISVSGLIRAANASPNLVLDYVALLVSSGIVRERREGGSVKAHIRLFYPNLEDSAARRFFSFVEKDKLLAFIEKYPNLRTYLSQLSDVLGRGVSFALVYGSYARFAASRESDLDVLIVGKLSREELLRVREVFVTFDAEPSIIIETPAKFRKNLKNSLHQNILKEHIVFVGEERFISAAH